MDSESHLGIELQEDNKIPKKSCKFGKVVVGITGATALGIVLVNVPFVTQALRKICLPYVPATERQVANITKPAKTSKRQGSTMLNLLLRVGKTISSWTACQSTLILALWQVFAAARHGYQAHGYKLNHWLVWYSKLQARLQGLHKKDTFSRDDLWKECQSQGENKVCRTTDEHKENLRACLAEIMLIATLLLLLPFPG
ncbi:ATP synthase subunit C lysine N-methyltransferase-like [Montipora capricornis]|uniref:ATP synthase subunit C lysine N-methyltransferase-like n=1 Tax=Montipora capricornis TaxID=246305 RepID=UPI0035F1D0F3